MKQFFYSIIFITISFAANAQTGIKVIAPNLSIVKAGENMVISWNDNNANDGSWEVQGSIDGKTFETLGLVWGSDPKAARNSFIFKQELTKIQSKFVFYRVLYADAGSTVLASKVIEFSK